jgi:hypothetical protein
VAGWQGRGGGGRAQLTAAPRAQLTAGWLAGWQGVLASLATEIRDQDGGGGGAEGGGGNGGGVGGGAEAAAPPLSGGAGLGGWGVRVP